MYIIIGWGVFFFNMKPLDLWALIKELGGSDWGLNLISRVVSHESSHPLIPTLDGTHSGSEKIVT